MKLENYIPVGMIGDVAPLVGAWIEIVRKSTAGASDRVAPLVGAWIEIVAYRMVRYGRLSLPSWERGLKL